MSHPHDMFVHAILTPRGIRVSLPRLSLPMFMSSKLYLKITYLNFDIVRFLDPFKSRKSDCQLVGSYLAKENLLGYEKK